MSRQCQSKVKLLEQAFRLAYREFQQWLVNARINTAKCFDVPQNLSEASSSLLKIQVEQNTSRLTCHRQLFFNFRLLSRRKRKCCLFSSPQEFLSDRDQGQSKLNAVVASGELVSVVAVKDRAEAVRTKMNTAREDWKNLMSNLHSREAGLQVSSEQHQSLTLAGSRFDLFIVLLCVPEPFDSDERF